MSCICTPAGQVKFFLEAGVPVATRTTPPPKLGEAAQAEFRAKAEALGPNTREAAYFLTNFFTLVPLTSPT
jgi:hypothetical protein